MADTKWYYNSNSGNLHQDSPSNYYFQIQLHLGIGWHGPFDTQQDAINYYNANKSKNPGWQAPVASVGVSQGVSNIATATTEDALGINQGNIQSWFLRVGEILIGLVLLAVGVAKITGQSNTISSAVKAKTS